MMNEDLNTINPHIPFRSDLHCDGLREAMLPSFLDAYEPANHISGK